MRAAFPAAPGLLPPKGPGAASPQENHMSHTRTYLKGEARQDACQQAAELYAQGCTIRSIATQLGRSYGGTRALLLEAKVTLRTRGGGIRKTGA